MKTNDPRLARPQPPTTAPANPFPPVGDSILTAERVKVSLVPMSENDAESRRLWALGLIATCSNQSTLFGELGTEERRAAAQEILRLSRIPARITKG